MMIRLRFGNLVRHSLTMASIGMSKAEALEKRLNEISPHSRVKGESRKIKSLDSETIRLVQDSSVIIDCSASDDVLYVLSKCKWPKKHLLHFYFQST